MLNHFHVVVWLDNREARVTAFSATAADHSRIHATDPHQHLHTKTHSAGSGHSPVDHDFFERVCAALSTAGAVLVVGPGNAKTELMKHIAQHHPLLTPKVSAVQTVDHPSDGELLALGRAFFKGDDRMHAQG
jgi:stalled ribosome rescue protein Dom34